MAPAGVGLLAACPAPAEGPAGTRTPSGPGQPGSTRILNGPVANPDRPGVEAEPDYDRDAAQVRADVTGRLPDPLPDVRTACVAMLDAASGFYRGVESSLDARAKAADNLRATRNADLRACVAETSSAAAVCVTVLLGDRDREFPKLLDQCSRAFPKGTRG